ncbi:MAG: sulfurtransferase-like selenium metabolism protein YedF [Spirochaetaceae bacterium]|jgi:selenium metabolism protein YedF|nr:sulfurtransferase-like selenium metabolism protein YedF [Spirochaetaceae bacterium]
MKTLDMLGQPCPIPVVKAKEVLAVGDAEGVIVLVDNIAAVRNLEKMANGTGCGFSYTEEAMSGASVYRAVIVKGVNSHQSGTEVSNSTRNETPETFKPAEKKKGPVVLISSDCMGRGADDLGRLLIKGFIFSLTQIDPPPEALVFLNGGARLTTGEANTVPDLKTLEEKGAGVYTCGTCANYYKLADSLAVGSIVDMMYIANLLSGASSVITI